MSDHNDPDLLAHVREDVRAALLDVADLVARFGDAGVAGAQADCDALAQMVRADSEALASLELIIPIVAPMSAGKSTIINAIAGADLLPSRATAMTTLPTRIVLDPEVSSPVLRIAAEDVGTLAGISGEAAASPDDSALEGQPHLRRQLDEIRSGAAEEWRCEYHGTDTIHTALTRINDLIRIAELLQPGGAPGQRLQQAPTLHAPYRAAAASDVGRVVLVDTPGNDDNAMESRLTAVVAQQLSLGHQIIVVLNFTAMNNAADGKIKVLVEPTVRELGADRLFAVVNKVDQRKSEADPDPEAVASFVQTHLGIPAERRDRIVETKALQGLQASRLLARLEYVGGVLDLQTDPVVAQFVVELYPNEVDRAHQMRTLTVEHLRLTAENMWATSGIPRMLDSVVEQSRTALLRTLLESVLRRTEGRLLDLAESVRTATAAALQAAEDAEAQTADLDRELAEIEELKDRPVVQPGSLAEARTAALNAATTRALTLIDQVRGNEKGFNKKRQAREFVANTIESPKARLQTILDEAHQAVVEEAQQALHDLIGTVGAYGDLPTRAAAYLGKSLPQPPGPAPVVHRVDLGRVDISDSWDSYEKDKDFYTVTKFKSDLSDARYELRRSYNRAMAELEQQASWTSVEIAGQLDAYATELNKLLTDYAAMLIAERDERATTAERYRRQIAGIGRQADEDIQDRRGRLSGYLEHLDALS